MRKTLLAFLAIAAIFTVQVALAQDAGTADRPSVMEPLPKDAVAVDVIGTAATVKAVDQEQRTVTLEMPDGTAQTCRARREVELAEFKAGDKVQAQVIQAVAISVEKGAVKPEEKPGEAVLAPKDTEPRILRAPIMTVTAKVDAVDVKNGTLTLTMADEKPQTMTLGPKVEGADTLKKGDEVTVKYTQPLVLDLAKA